MNFFQETFVTGTHMAFFAMICAVFLFCTWFASYQFFKDLIENNKKLDELKKDNDNDDTGALGF